LLSEAQLSLIRRAAALACEIEEMESHMSRGIEVNLDSFGRAASHLRRIYEAIGLRRQPREVEMLADYLARTYGEDDKQNDSSEDQRADKGGEPLP
jgi:hypothetical protein